VSGAPDPLAPSDGAPVVRATDVSKVFRLYRERPLSMRSAFTGFHRARYEEFWAVRNVSLEVPRGQMLGIIGHNGSGKSTFLRLLAGVYRPTTGEVSVNGRVSALLELGAGFHPELSGRENIYMNGAILGLERGEVADLVEDIVAFSGIGDFVDNPVDVYSSGMRARLGFAVSVFLRPDVLLADEIIAVGDAAFAAQCMEHLQDMRDQGVTVVLVSHSLSLVERLCDTAAWLDHGEIRMVGDPSEIVLAYGDHMAERAAHQRSTATGDSLDDGSGPEHRIRHITVQGPSGAPYGATGGPMEVVVDYRCRTPVEDPRFVLRLYLEGRPLSLGTASGSVIEAPAIVGDGRITCRLPVLPLAPGSYRLDVALRGLDGELHTRLAAASAHFDVQFPPEQIPEKLVELNGVWEHLELPEGLDRVDPNDR
jgi:ABC-type polysaccharide/polyol phosphate transport system ATPase subunit